jgi:hypothetical protein
MYWNGSHGKPGDMRASYIQDQLDNDPVDTKASFGRYTWCDKDACNLAISFPSQILVSYSSCTLRSRFHMHLLCK